MPLTVRILIADDEFVSRRVLEATLKRAGHEVIACNDGDEAIRAYLGGDTKPSIAILDWDMPGISGIELCRRLRARSSEAYIYIIMLTARDSTEDVVEGFDAGADDFVSKPFQAEELTARIRAGERIVKLETSLAKKVAELEAAEGHVEQLQGILPICMHCHKIRNDNAAWEKVETYIATRSHAQFSHCLCSDCFSKQYPAEAV